MNAFDDRRKKQAVVLWADRQLADAKDIIRGVETGEHFQLVRLQSDGAHDETHKAYLKAMQDIWHLEWLLEILDDQSEHPRPDNTIMIPPLAPDHR